MPDPPPVTTASFPANESIAMMPTSAISLGSPARSRVGVEPPTSGLDQAGAEGQAGEIGAGAAAGLVPDPVQVRADRTHGDVQLTRDLRVGVAPGDQRDEFTFPGTEPRQPGRQGTVPRRRGAVTGRPYRLGGKQDRVLGGGGPAHGGGARLR